MATNIELEEEIKGLKEIILKVSKEQIVLKEKAKANYPDMGQEHEVEEEELPPQIRVETPIAYRKVVDNLLGKDFEIEMDKMTDRASYVFTIIVPNKHRVDRENMRERTVIEDGKKRTFIAVSEDRRTKVISEATGVNEAKDWCEKIKKNLLKGLSNEGKPWPK